MPGVAAIPTGVSATRAMTVQSGVPGAGVPA